VRQHRVQLESARFIDRLWLREALLRDPAVDAAAARAASEQQTPLMELRQRIEAWVDEMVPAFSITAYYRLGGGLARVAVNLCYELVFDAASYERADRQVPTGAIRVFVINHRSNADYVVLSYGLLKHVALSYAVGEWARVWPLDLLFRAFGSYFIRRGERDRLYHVVLERYVQLLVGHGGVTGFFPEGRLTRDGAMGPAKAGLLDYILGVRREQPGQPIWFIPVGLNFDRVFEDRSLIASAEGAPKARDKAGSALRILWRAPVVLGSHLLRLVTRTHRGFGYAAVTVGQPVSLDELQVGEIAALPFEQRWPQVKALAAQLIERVGRVVPATPVPLLASALLEGPGADDAVLVRRIAELLRGLRAAGAPVARGEAFAHMAPVTGQGELAALDAELAATSEAELMLSIAYTALRRRGILRRQGGRIELRERDRPVLQWYARSIAHHLGAP
jgi:glycerol-3-phosphate O-acyltransferase